MTGRRPARLLALLHDTRGATAPIVALLGAVLIGTTGVALDTGLYFTQDGDLESVTQAAALSAAAAPNIADAQSRATAYLANNGYPAAKLKSVKVTLGYFCPDNDPSTRSFSVTTPSCAGGSTGQTALRLETTAKSSRYLTAALGAGALIPDLASTVTAARIDEAGLEMTTGVARLDPGLVNSLLSLLAGRSIALTGAQLDALLASNVDAGRMFDALAARVGETGTYGDLVNRTVPVADILNACATAMGPGGDTTTINVLQLLAVQIGTVAQVPLKDLFGLGVWKNTPVDVGGIGTAAKTGLRAGVNSYQLLTYALQSGGRTANLPGLQIGIPGVANVRLAGMATTPLNRARFAFGPKGETSVGTAALRLQLSVKLLDTNALLGALGISLLTPVSDLDVMIQVAAGQAQITGISCGQEAATDTQVAVAANSGLLDVFLGKPPADALSPTRPSPLKATDFTPTTLVNVAPLGINVARVQLGVSAGSVTQASANPVFVQSGAGGGNATIGRPPYGGTAYMVGNKSALADTLRTLQLKPSVCIAILPCVTTGDEVSKVLTTVAAPITALGVDPLVDSLLRGLGLQLGYTNIWVTGARCGVPVLV